MFLSTNPNNIKLANVTKDSNLLSIKELDVMAVPYHLLLEYAISVLFAKISIIVATVKNNVHTDTQC